MGEIAIEIVLLIVVAGSSLFWKSYLTRFVEEKGKNLATKQDIEDITRKVEAVKNEFEKSREVFSNQYSLKREACLDSLGLIDAWFSHSLEVPVDGSISKQYASIEHIRRCHNSLLLACEDPEIVRCFTSIMFGPKEGEQPLAPTDALNKYRNLIRRELGFGTDLELDREKAWFGATLFEKSD